MNGYESHINMLEKENLKLKKQLKKLKVNSSNNNIVAIKKIYNKLLFKWIYKGDEKIISLYDINEIFDEYINRGEI